MSIGIKEIENVMKSSTIKHAYILNLTEVPKDTTELYEQGEADAFHAKVAHVKIDTNVREGMGTKGEFYNKKATPLGTKLIIGVKNKTEKDAKEVMQARVEVLGIAGEVLKKSYSVDIRFIEIGEALFSAKKSKQRLKAPVIRPIKNLKIEKDKEGIEYIEVEKYPSLYVKKYKDETKIEQYFTHGITLKMFDIMCKEGEDNIGILKDTVKFYDKRESNTLTQEEKETLNPLFNEILGKLRIDKDKNGRLQAGELAGLTLSQEKQKELSYMVAKHESEWENPTRFEKLATFMDEMKATEYAEMMRDRTKKLSFFDDVYAMDFSPTFFHPLALVGVMVRDCKKKKRLRVFDIEDAKIGLKYIYDTYGRDIARIVERMYRVETGNFTSEQYQYGATAGMERHGKAPYYGWTAKRFVTPPLGTWSSFEGKGLSVIGGTKQNIKTKKDFLILDSVTNAMTFLAQYIKDYNGDYARWYRTDEVGKATYRARVEDKYLRQSIFDSIEAGTLVIKEKPYIDEDECEDEIEEVEEVLDSSSIKAWVFDRKNWTMTSPDGKNVYDKVYAGAPGYKNKGDKESLKNKGPIPKGLWKITGKRDILHGHKHSNVLVLTPNKDTKTHGRSAFLIHGDNSTASGSNGCIILNGKDKRLNIFNSGIKYILVK